MEYEEEDIVDFSHKKKRLIDSGDEQEVNPVQLKPSKQVKKEHEKVISNESEKKVEKKIEKKNEEVQKLDKKKLKYLFEPDESQETITSKDEIQEVKRKKVKKEENQTRQPIVQTQKKEPSQVGKLDELYLEVLNRWWYCFGEWPPENYDYNEKLKAYNLRKVEQNQFKFEAEMENGLRKVYQVDGYPGVFKTSAGDTLDLRPIDTCPSIEKIKQINQQKLPSLYMKGLRAQLEDLIKHEPNNQILQEQLKNTINQVQKRFSNFLD